MRGKLFHVHVEASKCYKSGNMSLKNHYNVFNILVFVKNTFTWYLKDTRGSQIEHICDF